MSSVDRKQRHYHMADCACPICRPAGPADRQLDSQRLAVAAIILMLLLPLLLACSLLSWGWL